MATRICGCAVIFFVGLGIAMPRAQPVALLLADLGVIKTHSRPHVSNDNPFSEAHFKTLNTVHGFPSDSDQSKTAARSVRISSAGTTMSTATAASVFSRPRRPRWPGGDRARPSPARPYGGLPAQPERFVKGRPRPADVPQAVWINPPAKNRTAQDAPETTIVISDDSRSTQFQTRTTLPPIRDDQDEDPGL
jgi:putative transposase